MYGTRELLAVALALGLGLLCVAWPEAVLRLQWFTFDTTSGRHGSWGGAGEDDGEREFADWMFWAVRLVGAVLLLIGAAILAQPHL